MLVRVMLIIAVQICTATAFYGQSITFGTLPANYQLFARNSANLATIPISGTVVSANPEKIIVQLWRENQLRQRTVLTVPASRPASFSTSVPLRAEKAQYAVRIYALTGTDSSLVVERTNIVCGDFIQLYGQSNAIPTNPSYILTDDTYLRNCYFVGAPTDGQVSWYPAKQPYGTVGIIGWRIQELILNQFGIPTCIINGAIGGASIDYLGYRNPQNHADLSTPYGQTLYRHQWAQAIPSVRAIIWKQGENEAGSYVSGTDYGVKFDQLYQNWREDYGPAVRIYLSQINMLGLDNNKAAGLRDFQRRTRRLYTNLETIATVGAQGYDGVHYSINGNIQIANELFRQLARDIYQSSDTLQINSPDIRKAYLNTTRDSLTMVFDEQMQMVWPADSILYDPSLGQTYVRTLKDFIYLNGQSGLVRSGTAQQHRVVLALTQPSSATALAYLPSSFQDIHSPFYNGVHLTNARGMRTFSFENVPVATALAVVPIQQITLLAGNQVRLSWNIPSPLPTGYQIERANTSSGPFTIIARLGGAINTFTDSTGSVEPTWVYYRLRALSNLSESPLSPVVSLQTANLTLADLSLTMSTSSRVARLSAPVTISLVVSNAGPASVTSVVVENRLPPNLQFVAGQGVTYSSGVVSATSSTIPVGQTASWTFTASPQQPGTYENAAQIVSASHTDPDSQPGSGTADGEDDEALIDFRTSETDNNGLFVSPNPNQRVLPTVLSSQPTPVAGKADLSLRMVSSRLALSLNDLVSFTLSVSNAGGATAQSATIKTTVPTGITLTDATGWQINGSQLTIPLQNITVGSTVNVVYTGRAISNGVWTTAAEISSASPNDPDSTPGNGTTNGEDDTAQLSLRVR